MRIPFKIKFFFAWLMVLLLAVSGTFPAFAATSNDTNTGTMTFLLQGVTGPLNLQDVLLAYKVPTAKYSVYTYNKTLTISDATLSATDNGYLLTIPNVDWSLATSYQVLLDTDHYIWTKSVNQTLASQGPITLTTDNFAPVPSVVNVSSHPDFQLQQVVMAFGGWNGNVPFFVPVSSGQWVDKTTYYDTYVYGHDTDHEYFLRETYFPDSNATITEPFPLTEITADNSDPTLSLSGVGMSANTDFTYGFSWPKQMYFWDPSLQINKFYVQGDYSDISFAYRNSNGYNYVYSTGGHSTSYTMPTAYHFDGNLTVSATPNRLFYHAGDTIGVPQDLGLKVVDGKGNQMTGVYDDQGHAVLGRVELAHGTDYVGYDVDWHNVPQSITLPNHLGDYSLTFKVPTGPTTHMQVQQTISLTQNPIDPQIFPVTDTDTTIRGIAEPGWTIEPVNFSSSSGYNVVLLNGSFSVPLVNPAKPNTWLTLRFIDTNQKQHFVSVLVQPRDPQLNPVKDTDKLVTGMAEPNSTITVTTTDKVIGKATTNKSGTFSVTIKPQLGGEELFVHVHSGQAGITDQLLTTVVTDTTPPDQPDVRFASDNSQLYGYAEPDSTITIYKDGQVLATGTTNDSGVFSFDYPLQPAGTILSITATDSWGNESKPTVIVVNRGGGPIIQTINPVKDVDTKITGVADSNIIIMAKVGTRTLAKVYSDANGNFSLPIPKQKGGTVVTVIAVDYFQFSRSEQVTVQGTVAPAAPRVNAVSHISTKVTGSTVANATITITVNDTTYTGQADKYGRFTIPIDPQAKGNKLLVTATDQWGNTSKATTVTVF